MVFTKTGKNEILSLSKNENSLHFKKGLALLGGKIFKAKIELL